MYRIYAIVFARKQSVTSPPTNANGVLALTHDYFALVENGGFGD
jgi:hypothetical protein